MVYQQKVNFLGTYITMAMIFIFAIFSSTNVLAQRGLQEAPLTYDLKDRGITTSYHHTFDLDIKNLRSFLSKAPLRSEKNETWLPLDLPLSDGKIVTMKIAEAIFVGTDTYKRYPENRAYKVKSIDDSYLSGMLIVTAEGLHAYLKTESKDVYIEPLANGSHVSYTPDSSMKNNRSCETTDEYFGNKEGTTTRDSYGATLREYTIAIASSGEFSNERNNDLAVINADIMVYLGELNALYESEMSISFVLADDNDDIIFFDPATDGIDPSTGTSKILTAHSAIAAVLASSEYDIGHVFYEIPGVPAGASSGSGIAGVGVTCLNSFKGRGWSGCGGSYSTAFWMSIFSHEIGHQLGAFHSFYGTSANCVQRSAGHGAEPGSGNSLMSYEGRCFQNGACPTTHNITPEVSSVYLHAISIEEIQDYLAGTSCSSNTSSGNAIPVLTLPSNYTIPAETPFSLTASATDADGDNLTYSWEEMDLDSDNLSCPDGDPDDAATSTTAPLFRSFDPSASGATRHFPQISDIVDNTQTKGEILPEVDRTILMRMTVRDDNAVGGAIVDGDVTLTVEDNAGPFVVNTANTPTAYSSSQNVNIQWSVANTNASPISCSNVNILFSTDGGNTFPITLASNVANDGSHTVTMPTIGTTIGRIKVEAVGNIFFDINKADITIISGCNPLVTTILNTDPVTAEAGDTVLDLDLIIGEILTSASGTLDGSSPTMNLTVKNIQTNNCTTFGNTPRYGMVSFTPTETGSYSFSSSAPFFEIMNVYTDPFIENSPCTNWLDSSGEYNPSTGFVSTSSPYSITLTEDVDYDLVLSGFNSGDAGAWSINFSGAGDLYVETLPPTGYTNIFVISDENGIIKGIETDADLSNAIIYTGGVYTVESLMYLSTENLDSYVDGNLSSLKNATNTGVVCGIFGSSTVTVTIEGCTASTQTVTSGADDGNPGSLRAILADACPEDLIVFSPSLANTTITFNTELTIDKSVTIQGLGNASTTLSGNNSNRIFNIESGHTLDLLDMRLINGFASGNNGGAFINNGTVTIEDVIFESNLSGIASQAFANFGDIELKSGSIDIIE